MLFRPGPAVMKETTFLVPKMDCPSEERLIRLAVEPLAEVSALRFDLDARSVVVTHTGDAGAILDLLTPLRLGARIESTTEASPDVKTPSDPAAERRVLWVLLAINGVMFAVEMALGFVAQSTGLISDSLDMLADAMVYGLSLAAVGRAAKHQVRAAHTSGVLQGLLALGAISEVVRRAITGSEPVEGLMIGVALAALAANLTCVALLARHRKGGVHLRASWIFSTNDALANLGVVAAGALVAVTGSAIPDLVIGTVVALIVFTGAVRILRLR